ncbi:MAG TPA: ATPase, T2SS/T4P/T4SS family [Microbacteriaceae bacterium]
MFEHWFMKLAIQLRQLLEIVEVSDVLLMGHEHSYVFDGRWQRVANPFRTSEKLREQILDLVIQSGERWDVAKPYVDFSFGNYRFHALMGGAVASVDQLSIRIHQHLEDQSLDPKLRLIAESSDSFLISGVTGSGKTTMLSKMLRANPERTVLIEQTPEIDLEPPSVTLHSRRANIEGAGAVEIDELLNQALRMRPDRIAIGEVRGKEIFSLLLAINNGHKGAAATVHASSPGEVSKRLITLGLMAGIGKELVLDLSNNLDWLIHVENRELSGIYRWAEL